ncbi:response regulator transcription factor [Actinophytocola algeriensis]|uniref:Two-component system OmpR family response regulator n=1 Tax=Actinophytocola algeriensis TaxID=1768010 RepID=A0A7W7Q2M3_9PSEU|nr:two-component system OmpR family response regulator [Actinophytocola algeriensis]MBE1472430.1 two-component system OmpR family response regulator [Actinophytocola algeriensis]
MDRILVVDDDPGLRELLLSTLRFAGFEVEAVGDVPAALAAIGARVPDAIVLDVMLPGTDGFDLLHLLRARDVGVPVMFLTARDELDDRVRGLRMGGDDYLTKPFDVVEVAARLEALLRRARRVPPSVPEGVLRCGDLEMDEARHVVTRGGRPVELSPTEFRLLRYLLANSGRVVSKAQILDHVWQYDFGGDTGVVERFVSNLRRKIDFGGPSVVRTVRGFGYSLRPVRS